MMKIMKWDKLRTKHVLQVASNVLSTDDETEYVDECKVD